MARRSAGSRSRSRTSSRSSGRSSGRSSSRSSRGAHRTEAGVKVRADGRVDAPCPHCGTAYRVKQEALDALIECQECHRSFHPKTTAGRRAKKQDYSKVYLGFGALAVFIVITFSLMSSGDDTPKKPNATPPSAKSTSYTRSDHPRTAQVVKWAQAIRSRNDLVLTTHSDLRAIAKRLGVDPDEQTKVIAALRSDPTTRYLRELECSSGSLLSDAAMTASEGGCVLYLLPPPGSKDYENDRAEVEVSFRMEGDQVKVVDWKETRKIRRLTPDPNAPRKFKVSKHIAAAKQVEISDSAGTRKVAESEPGPVPHWEGADEALRAKVDEVIAGVLRSADADGPPLARFTLKIRELDERKAAVPRALNAMYELYSDVNANNMKLSQLNQALVSWTGYAVNYQVKSSGDPELDRKRRASCIRQWFGFWWKYCNTDLQDFYDMSETIDDPAPPADKDKD